VRWLTLRKSSRAPAWVVSRVPIIAASVRSLVRKEGVAVGDVRFTARPSTKPLWVAFPHIRFPPRVGDGTSSEGLDQELERARLFSREVFRLRSG
jgi:hypothetical protein